MKEGAVSEGQGPEVMWLKLGYAFSLLLLLVGLIISSVTCLTFRDIVKSLPTEPEGTAVIAAIFISEVLWFGRWLIGLAILVMAILALSGRANRYLLGLAVGNLALTALLVVLPWVLFDLIVHKLTPFIHNRG